MKQVTPELNLQQVDARVLNLWKEQDTFRRSLDERRDAAQYLFYDGPPFSSGLPHYGHLLAGTIKDIIPRYQTMKGFCVERRFGWDTHGLPIEMIIERELGLKGRSDILTYGVDRFNEACRAGVLSCVKVWEEVTTRLGRWVDFRNDYKTMDLDFMESVWWVFKQLWERGRIYQGYRVMPYSWRLATPLSNFEATSNYKIVQDPAITVRFRLKERPGVSALAWTTTPWTLPSNLALCVGPKIQYVEIETKDGERLLLAEARLAAYFRDKSQYTITAHASGEEIADLSYEPLFPYYADLAGQGAFRILCDDYVTTEDGTGVVHQSPAHGEDDHRIGQRYGLPLVDPVDSEGNFSEPVEDFRGRNIKEADPDIIRALKDKGLLFKHETTSHSYPFCERSDTPLIYKAISAWYVRVTDLRENMLRNNQDIHWVPEHIKTGRFHNWLAQALDWNISRNRFWGNPLPIWQCENCDQMECLGSRAELEQRVGHPVDDLHKHFVDQLHWTCPSCGGRMTRTPEVLDCWFESGAMPYAQLHYPFENKERFESVFPADFIAEGLDQTRGWFYTLMILSTILFEKAPFKNCVVNGLILAEDGKKMSKRLKNYPDPLAVIDSYGADALRLYLINSPVVKGESLRFSEHGVREIVRSVLLPFWNVYSFFTTYASIDKFVPSNNFYNPGNTLDAWILSRFQTLLGRIEEEMSQYRLYTVVPILLEFLEELTNWYVRRSRRRFWSENSGDKQQGYDTLYYILINFSKALAPFLPFITEEIYQNLRTLAPEAPEAPDSVHLCSYPTRDGTYTDVELESEMALIQGSVKLGRALRTRLNLRVRQPLQSVTVVTHNEDDRKALISHGEHLREELNVKEVLFSAHEEELVTITVKPNYPVLGPIFGKRMKEAAQILAELPWEQIVQLEAGRALTVLDHEVNREAVQIIRTPKSDDLQIETAAGVTVFFDTTLSDTLIKEGLAREFVNRVQRMRKEANFHVSDRIKTVYRADYHLSAALEQYRDYINGETLTVELAAVDEKPGSAEIVQQHFIDGSEIDIALSRLTE